MIYHTYRNNPLWDLIGEALDKLEENEDIEFKTEKDYVIGYLVMCVNSEKGIDLGKV